MTELIRLSRSCVGAEEKNAVCRVIEEGSLGMGVEVMLFEKELQAFFSSKMQVACVNNGTAALQLALQACGVGSQDEVLIPSITYVASFQATTATGARAVACDIDMSSGNLNISDAEKRINKKTKVIMYVQYAGNVENREDVFKLAKKYNLRVIEDAAHSFGGCHKGQRIGETGDILCFSFDGIKNITCGEGGAVVSSDPYIMEKVRDLRLLAVQKDSEKRYTGQRSWDFEVEEQGWRYHMSNINAAIGREQLKKIGIFSEKRRFLAKLYQQNLKGKYIRHLNLDLDNIVPHIFPILVDKKHRDALKIYLYQNNIETGIHYKPNHLLAKFKGFECPAAEFFGSEVLSLPLHPSLTPEMVSSVISCIGKYFG